MSVEQQILEKLEECAHEDGVIHHAMLWKVIHDAGFGVNDIHIIIGNMKRRDIVQPVRGRAGYYLLTKNFKKN